MLVLLDGQRLNSPQTGEVDLSAISLEQIERIEIVRQGNSALFGGSAFGGVIAFYTKEQVTDNSARIQGRTGSFSTLAGNAAIEKSLGNAGILADYYQDFSQSNFSYTYEEQKKTRKNAWYRNNKLFSKLYYHTSCRKFAVLYSLSKGNRGLPSTYFDEQIPFAAKLQETVQAVQLHYRWILFKQGYLEGQAAYHRLYQLYMNNSDDVPRKKRYETEQINGTWEGNVRGHFFLKKYFELQVGVSYLQEILDQKNLLYPAASIGKKTRRSNAIYGSTQIALPGIFMIAKAVKLRAALRYEKVFEQKARMFPFMGMSLIPGFLPQVNVSLNWAKAVRYPDFNSLFWKGDARARGNPELAPERKKSWNLSVRYSAAMPYLPELSWFHFWEKIDDLIFWHRTFNGVWEPRNEERVEKCGWDLQVRQNIYPDYIQFRAAYSHIDARNKKDDPVLFDKKLIFVAEHAVNLSLWMGWRNWQSQLVYRYVSQRETVTANSNGTQLPEYSVCDVSAGCQKSFGQILMEFGFALKNITNQNYQLIMGYPMPGREYQFTISLNFQTNKK